MDTIETQEPAGEAEFTPSEDTSSNDTQPVETGEVSTTESEEAGEATETLLAGKYKTPEELVKAHKELESKLGELGQKAKLTSSLEQKLGMSAQEIEALIEQQEQAQLQQRIAEDPSGYAVQEIQTLKAQLALKEEQAELDGFINKNPEYAPFKDKILNLGLNLEREKTYEDIAKEYFGGAIAQGQQDAYKRIETKQNTQASSVSRGTPKPKLTLEDLRSMSSEEQAAVLPHAGR